MSLQPCSRQLCVACPSLSIWRILRLVLTMIMRHQPRHLLPKTYLVHNLSTVNAQFDLEQSIEGPFSTSPASRSITQRKEQLCMASLNQAPHPNCPLLDLLAFKWLVFMHNHLNLRNLLLDDDHVLWVNFEFVGFFPLWSSCNLSILG